MAQSDDQAEKMQSSVPPRKWPCALPSLLFCEVRIRKGTENGLLLCVKSTPIQAKRGVSFSNQGFTK